MKISIRSVLLFVGALCLCTSSFGEANAHANERNLQVERVPMDSEDMPIPATHAPPDASHPDDSKEEHSYKSKSSKSSSSSKSPKSSKEDDDSAKSSKTDKSSKSPSKSAKTGKSSKDSVKVVVETNQPTGVPTGVPTNTPTVAPTKMPVAPTPTTPEPTSQNSLEVRPSRYSLLYSLDITEPPSESNFAEVTELTRIFLEEVMISEFAQTSLTNLDDFLTVQVRQETAAGEDFPVTIEFQSIGLFNPNSIFLPTVRELDQLVTGAFQGDNLPEYIKRLNALPSANPLSRTADVVKGPPIGAAPRASGNGGLSGIRNASSTTAGLAAAAAGILVLAAGLVVLRKRRDAAEGIDAEFEEQIQPTKDTAGDKTVSSDTCGMSVDTSGDWQVGKTYIITESENEDDSDDLKERTREEFQDEYSDDMKDVPLRASKES